MDPTVLKLNDKMNELAMKRQEKTAWALHDSSELKRLVEKITTLIENLETLFSAPDVQGGLAGEEAAAIQDIGALQLIEDVAEGVDDLLKAAAKDVRIGHQYKDYVVTGHAKVLTGDFISSEWKGEAVGASHVYEKVRVEGNARVLSGNRFGGKDFFDD